LNYIIFWFLAVIVFPKIAGKWLVFDKASGYEFISHILFETNLGDKPMALSTNKQRPAHVPEENVYTSLHWLMIAAYAASAVAVFLLIKSAG